MKAKLWKVKYKDRRLGDGHLAPNEKSIHVIAGSLEEVEDIICYLLRVRVNDIFRPGYNKWNEIISVTLVDKEEPLRKVDNE